MEPFLAPVVHSIKKGDIQISFSVPQLKTGTTETSSDFGRGKRKQIEMIAKKIKVRLNSKKRLTNTDEDRNMKNGVGIEADLVNSVVK